MSGQKAHPPSAPLDAKPPATQLGASVRQQWLDVLELAEKRPREDTRAAIAQVLSSAGGARFEAIAARILLLANDFDGALRAVARAEATCATAAEQRLVSAARAYATIMLGEPGEAMAELEPIVQPDASPALLLAAIDLALRSQAFEAARRWTALIERHPSATSQHILQVADLLRLAGAHDAAIEVLRSLLRNPGERVVDRCEVAQMLLSCRACDEAAEVFRAQVSEGNQLAKAHLGLSTIHLWRGEIGAAVAHANAADAESPAARRVVAAAALLEGRATESLAALDALILSNPTDPETRAWRAEALLRCGQPEAALAETRVAGDFSPDHGRYLALRVLEALAALHLGRRPNTDRSLVHTVSSLCGIEDGNRVRRFLRRHTPTTGGLVDRVLVGGSRLMRSAGLPVAEVDGAAAIAAILEGTLSAMGGNRTPETPTGVDGGRLRPLVVPMPPRAQVKAALYAVRIGGYAEARRRLDDLIDRHPDWPQPRFYRAELLMWVGLLNEARRDLEDSMSIRIRDREIERGEWPGIGLAGVHLLQGRPRDALRTIERAKRRFAGPPAQPYFAWYGEILRALGRLDEARAALEQVCPAGGLRLGSWIVLALTCRDLGDRDRPRRILAHVIERAPSLMIDVVRNSSEDTRAILESSDGLGRLSDDATRDLLERALAAMKGNRSASCVTFVDTRQRLRVMPPLGVHRIVNPADERKDLRAAIATL